MHGQRPRPRLIPAALVALLALTGSLLSGALLAAPAQAVPDGLGGFDPGNIMSDAVMFDGDAMTAAQVDRFLAEKGAACTTSRGAAPCLKDFTSSTPKRAATKYCRAIPARADASAGRIIADAARACDISPRVLLAMLQKEQGLVTTTAPTAEKYAKALGFSCPDFQPCDPAFAGLVNQVYAAASRLQEYGDPARGFRYDVGTQQIQYSPYAFCGTATVTIRNRATAALYNYTPYTPTQTVLDAGSRGVPDDACATYGNRNVYRIHSQWFGAPNGSRGTAAPIAAPRGSHGTSPFGDVAPTSEHFLPVAWMEHVGYATGWEDGTYRPLASMNRDAMAAFLYRAAGSPSYTPPKVSPFRDVSTGSQFYKEIAWAHSEGIARGWPDGRFRPTTPINRDAMAAFLYRAAGSPAHTPSATSPFTDVPTTSQFYTEISWASSQNIARGWSSGAFRPREPIARDAMAAFIYRWTL